MQTITITLEDDGRITVEAEGQEPYQCESSDECLQYVEGVMREEQGEAPGPEGAEASEPDMATMWDQEATKRSQTGQMA